MGAMCAAGPGAGAVPPAPRRTSSFAGMRCASDARAILRLFDLDAPRVSRGAQAATTPRSLQDLCLRELCRTLVAAGPQAGALPAWLPLHHVQRIVDLLTEHRALSLGVLAALRDCEVEKLQLAAARRVDDSWFVPLCASEIPRTLQELDLRQCRDVTDRGLRTLGCLPRLEQLNLEGCGRLSGAALAPLTVSHRLRRLCLAECRGMTAEGLRIVAALPLLEDLDLTTCGAVTDDTLRLLARCTMLRSLKLSQCTEVTDKGVGYLAGMIFEAPHAEATHRDDAGESQGPPAQSGPLQPALPRLTDLDLGWCANVTDAACIHLTTFPRLTRLTLARTRIGDVGVRRLASLQTLHWLSLSGLTRLTDVGVRALRRLSALEVLDLSSCFGVTSFPAPMERLRELNLNHTGLRDRHISETSGEGFPSLRSLSLDSCSVGDRGVKLLLRQLGELETVDLADLNLTHEGLRQVASLSKLRSANLFYCNMNEPAVRLLAGVKSLTELNLDNREIGDAALRHLVQLPSLTKLDVYSAAVTDDGIASLVQIKTLTHLEVCGGRVGNAGCALLAAHLPGLRHLNLSHNFSVSTSGLAALGTLVELRSLCLAHAFRVTSAGLKHIARLVNLEHLSLAGTAVREEDALKLQLSLPRLESLRVTVEGTRPPGASR